jgi:hypothetical protein
MTDDPVHRKLCEPMPAPGTPIAPLEIVQALRWAGELSPDEIVGAIRAAADIDLAARWPELGADEIETMRAQCRDMTKSRLRSWKSRGERDPTWLEVRALISGLHEIIE